MSDPVIDLETVKAVQQQIWSAGDFARIGAGSVIVGERLCESLEVAPGERVLDVACGSGNSALSAARRFAETTGLDYVPALLDHGRERAKAELVDVEWVEGDAENLPFSDGSFDVVMSTFGAMFAPNQQRTADELLRVCRPGGRIGMANWTPGGLIGQMFRITTEHAPPPVALDPPSLWGTEKRLRELFGNGISDLRIEHREWVFRYPSIEFWLEYFRTWFGPTKIAFARLDEAGAEAYAADLLALMRGGNVSGGEAMVAPSEYAEVVATRAG